MRNIACFDDFIFFKLNLIAEILSVKNKQIKMKVFYEKYNSILNSTHSK